jgi:parafibromin
MSTDSVSLLREYTIGKKPITLLKDSELVKSVADASTIKFDTTSFPRDAITIIKKGASSDEHYTLDTLIFLVENANLDNSAYFKECRSRHLEHVSIVDRRKILDYLTGKGDQLPNASTQGKACKKGVAHKLTFWIEKRQRDENATESNKKQKTAPVKKEESLGIVKEVEQRERELKTYESILKSSKNFSHAIGLAKTLVLGKEAPPPAGGRSAQPAKSAVSSQQQQQQQQQKVPAAVKGQKLSIKDRTPLIIVPAAPTAKFTLYNIKQFLEDQK